MANTYTKIYIQIVFSVKYRNKVIPKQHKDELHKYITGITQERDHKILAINSMPDHIHIFIGYNPAQALPDLINNIKTISSKFIKRKGWVNSQFAWQKGYGAFSYGASQIQGVIDYIADQENHHKKHSFYEEYIRFLKIFNIDYNPNYLFDL